MSSFRVLHVIGDSKFGGVVYYVVSLAKMARQHGGTVDVLVTDSSIVEKLAEDNINVVQLQGIRREINPILDSVALLRLYQYLSKRRYDIVHTHTSKGGFVGRLAAKAARVPNIVHTVQGFAFHDHSSGVETFVYSSLEKVTAICTDMLIIANDEDAGRALRLGIARPDKMAVIYNGIDIAEFDKCHGAARMSKRDIGIESDAKVVGMMARLTPQKGARYFIEAVPGVVRQFPGVKFVIIGDGVLRSELERLACKLDVAEHLIFLGFRADGLDLLNLLDVFVLPSLWEGMSMSLLQAMAAGKPVIATDIKGNREVVVDGQTGMLVSPKNPETLAAAILTLLKEEPLAKQYGSMGRKRLEEHFSEEIMMERCWAVYRRLMKRGQGISGGEK